MNWQWMLLAVSAGLLQFAAHPPIDQGWLGAVALIPLLVLARLIGEAAPRPLRAALGWGFVSGLTFFAPLLSWLMPFGFAAFGLLVLIQALYMGAFVAVVAWYGDRPWRPALIVATWVGLEALRAGWPLGGFGWGGLGYTQHGGDMLLGVARTLGVYGISAILAIIAVSIEEGIRRGRAIWAEARAAEVFGEVFFTAIRTPLLTVLGVLSLAVLLSGEVPARTGRTVEMGIAQAGDTRATSAAGVNRLDSDRIQRVAELALDATLPFAENPPDLVIWPENSLDIDVRTSAGELIRELLDQALATVAPSPILAGEYQVGPRPRTVFNQMTVFTLDGAGASYVKRKPVPFGEYVPARELLDWFPPLEQIPNDTLPGAAAQVLDVAGARVGGVICFENTFPALVRDQVLAGADVLVVGTNNSSFGDTAMSAQHIAFSQVRAVETGRWLVHAGISGISGFVSPEGDVFQQTSLFQPASPRMDVPLIEGITLAMRVGDLVPTVAQIVALGMVVVAIALPMIRARRAGASSTDS